MSKFDEKLMREVKRDLECGNIPMLLGEPGIGKSSWVNALAKAMRTKCFVLPCNQLGDKTDLTGVRLVPTTKEAVNDQGETITVQTGYKQMFFPHSVIYDAVEYALENPRETPILFMDELNRTTPDVTSEALSIPTMRKLGDTELPDNLLVITAGNDKGNITSLDTASISRFVLRHVEPDVNTFLALDPNLNPFIKDTLMAHPECIFCKKVTLVAPNDSKKDEDEEDLAIDDILDDGEDMDQIATPRTIMALSRWLNTYTKQEIIADMADMNMVNGREISRMQENIEAYVGETLFAAYLIQEIANKITTAPNTTAAPVLSKPACYDNLKASQDMTELNSKLTALSDNEKSGTLLYALFEKEDNSVLIRALAPITATLLPDDMKSLAKLAADDALDSQNVSVLSSTNCPLAVNLSIILEMAA